MTVLVLNLFLFSRVDKVFKGRYVLFYCMKAPVFSKPRQEKTSTCNGSVSFLVENCGNEVRYI